VIQIRTVFPDNSEIFDMDIAFIGAYKTSEAYKTTLIQLMRTESYPSAAHPKGS
jgi:hypothetical protein